MKKGNAIYNAVLGIVGFVIAALTLTLSAALLIKPRQEIDLSALKKSKIQACEVIGQREGFITTSDGNTVEMKTSGLSQYREKLLSSTILLTECEGFRMLTYCMGECMTDDSVSHQGIIMKFQYKDPVLK